MPARHVRAFVGAGSLGAAAIPPRPARCPQASSSWQRRRPSKFRTDGPRAAGRYMGRLPAAAPDIVARLKRTGLGPLDAARGLAALERPVGSRTEPASDGALPACVGTLSALSDRSELTSGASRAAVPMPVRAAKGFGGSPLRHCARGLGRKSGSSSAAPASGPNQTRVGPNRRPPPPPPLNCTRGP